MISKTNSTPTIVEVDPRDGLQSEQKVLDVGLRSTLITRLAHAGIKTTAIISAACGFPFKGNVALERVLDLGVMLANAGGFPRTRPHLSEAFS